MAKWEIPTIKIYFGEIDEISKQLGQLQTYKLFEGDDEILVKADEVISVLARHVKVTTVEPEIIRCKECKHYVDGYIHCNRVTWWNGEDDFCSRAERRDGCDDGGGA